MNQFQRLKKALSKPRDLLLFLFEKIAPIVPDKSYLRVKYYLRMGKRLNLNNPKTFNEKIQWLKIYGRTDINRIMSDKYLVKEFISKEIGDRYVIPLIGVWSSVDEINFDELPDKFVLKCNHNSGTGMVICKDKSLLNIEDVKKGLKKGLKEDYFPISREYAYKNIPRRIIAEEYMEDKKTHELRDYKFFCFDGVPKALFIASGRLKGEHSVTFDFFDMDYNHLPFTNGHPNSTIPIEKPDCFEEMKSLASRLSRGIPHVRVDFYEVNGRVYFGEFTFSHWGGFMPFVPEKWDEILGNWINLPIENNK